MTKSAPRQMANFTHSVRNTTVDGRYALPSWAVTREMRRRMTVVDVVSVSVARISSRKAPVVTKEALAVSDMLLGLLMLVSLVVRQPLLLLLPMVQQQKRRHA